MKLQRVVLALSVINVIVLVTLLAQDRPSPQPVVRTKLFELVDDRGRVRARLNVESRGEVVFRLMDQEGTIRVKLSAAEDGSGLLLANDATAPGVHMLAKAAGTTVNLVDKDGRERLNTP